MYIILKADENSSDIKITNRGKNAHYLYADNLEQAKAYLDELEDTDNFAYWSKYYAHPNLTCCKEFNNYLKQMILDTNKLSYNETIDLCKEYLSWLPNKPKPSPNIYIGISKFPSLGDELGDIWKQLFKIIDKYTQTKHNIKHNSYADYDFNPIKELGISIPFSTEISHICNCSDGGALNYKFYKFIYYFDFLGIPIDNPKLKDFWDFYKKTMNVYTIGFHYYTPKEIRVIPKPDELFIKDGVTHCKYDDVYYCDSIKVPDWFYKANRDDFDIKDLSKIKNADLRTVFIKKIGIDKFIKKGKVIDTWKNYPDNEWWAKSEYQLIDMKKFIVKKIEKYRYSRKIRRVEYFDYAPFLCMKNQTTGDYHLEGVSPDCRNLYDALKMRYQILDLPSYEIKNIK